MRRSIRGEGMNARVPDDAWIVPDWPAPVRAAVSTRWGPGLSEPPYARLNLGLHSGDRPERVRDNREILIQALGLPHPPRWLRQVHGTRVATLGPLPQHDEPLADAAVSRIPGTVLAILTADCLPVLLAARDGSEIAAAHAGWRGLAAGVLEATLGEMLTPASQILAWLGPCIGSVSYEIGEDVHQAFVRDDAGAETAFKATRHGHWQCDLATLAKRRLQAAGVHDVRGGGFDTRRDPRFYSYRRDGKHSGRFASLIWLPTPARDHS